MKTVQQQETEAFLRVMARLDYLEKQLDAAKQRIKELEAQIYGDSK
jgi:hypothetical protein